MAAPLFRLLCLFLLGLLLTRPATAFDAPAFQGDVLDEASLLSDADREILRERIRALREDSGIWAAVYVAKSLQGDAIESAAVATFEKWRLGQAGKDNGLLVLVAPVERKMRIEVGYGLEGFITDAFSKRIIDEIYQPAFREQRYAEGLMSGFDVMAKAAAGEAALPETAPVPDEAVLDVDWGAFFQRFALAVGANLVPPSLFVAARRYGRKKGRAGAISPAGESKGLFILFGFFGVFFGLFFAVFGFAFASDPEALPVLIVMNGIFAGLFFLPYAARARCFVSASAYRHWLARERLLRMRKRSPVKRRILGKWFDPAEVTTGLGGIKPEPRASSGSSFGSSSSSSSSSGGGRSGGGGASGSW